MVNQAALDDNQSVIGKQQALQMLSAMLATVQDVMVGRSVCLSVRPSVTIVHLAKATGRTCNKTPSGKGTHVAPRNNALKKKPSPLSQSLYSKLCPISHDIPSPKENAHSDVAEC